MRSRPSSTTDGVLLPSAAAAAAYVLAVVLVAAAATAGSVGGDLAAAAEPRPNTCNQSLGEAGAPRRLHADWSKAAPHCETPKVYVVFQYTQCGAPGRPGRPGPAYDISVRHPVDATAYKRVTTFDCPSRFNLKDIPFQDGFLDVVPILHVVNCTFADGPIACQLKIGRPEETETVSVRDAALGPAGLRPGLLAGLRGLRRLELLRCGITELPANLLDGLPALRELSLRGNGLRDDAEDALGGRALPLLQELDLGENALDALPAALLRGMPALAELVLSDNRLAALPAAAFGALPALARLYLGGNQLASLPAQLFAANAELTSVWLNMNQGGGLRLPQGLFANLPALQTVVLRKSDLAEIPRDSFWGSPALRRLDLSFNQLQELPADLLRDCDSLDELNVAVNKIKLIHENFFLKCKSLKTVKLADNQLLHLTRHALAGLGRLETLEAQGNSLTHVDTFANTPRLKTVDLSDNRLSFCEGGGDSDSPLAACAQLETLRLARNNMTGLCADWPRLRDLKRLDLHGNAIAQLRWPRPPNATHAAAVLVVDVEANRVAGVDLHALLSHAALPPHARVEWRLRGNPWHCACSQYAFLQRLRARRTEDGHVFSADGALCAAPDSLLGQPLSGVAVEALDCSVACAAPCRCRERPAEAVVEVDCAGLGLAEAPDWLPALPGLDRFRRVELLLGGNNLTSLPDLPGLGLDLGLGRVFNLSLSGNRLRHLPASLPDQLHIEVLELDRNEMTYIPDEMLRIMARRNLTVKLGHNPLECDCQLQPLVDFVQKNPWRVLDEPQCTNGQSLRDLKQPLCINSLGVSLSAPLAAFCAVAVISALYYKFRFSVHAWLYTHGLCLPCVLERSDDDLPYDVFISYSQLDETFVVRQLLPGLEAAPFSLRVCLPVRDFEGGAAIDAETCRCIALSRKTLVVMSPNFLSSVWGKHELRASHRQALIEVHAKVVILMLQDVGPLEDLDEELRAYLRMNTFVRWGQPFFWNHLRFLMPHHPARLASPL